MPKIRTLLTIPALLLACAGGAHALEITYENDSRSRMPLKPISEEQRQIDLQLGNCLKANSGRMTGRCAELRDRSEQAALAARAREESTMVQKAPN
jgi:hypothetical protein